jgi:hypothetical protein
MTPITWFIPRTLLRVAWRQRRVREGLVEVADDGLRFIKCKAVMLERGNPAKRMTRKMLRLLVLAGRHGLQGDNGRPSPSARFPRCGGRGFPECRRR